MGWLWVAIGGAVGQFTVCSRALVAKTTDAISLADLVGQYSGLLMCRDLFCL